MTRRLRLRVFSGLRRSSRGSVAIMVAVLAVPMIGAVALATDASIWLLEQHRLQIAADASAYAAALQLQNTAMHSGAPGSYVALVTNEANAASGGALVGVMATPAVSVAADFSNVTVTLSSKADTYFVQVVNSAVVTLQATAMAGLLPGSPCVLALDPATGNTLEVDNQGSIVAAGCGVFSNSKAGTAIHIDSGTISATSVGAQGGIVLSNSGSNSVSPTPASNLAAQADPHSGQYTLPAAGACTYTNYTATAYQSTPYALTPGTYCGNTQLGGNGSSDTFAAGTYVFTGNVTIQYANITQASGVTFIMVGATASANAGAFTWGNNSAATLSAPTTGAMSGLLLWQACSTSATSGSEVNGPITFDNGSTLTASGAIYAPCGSVQVQNHVQLKAASNSNFSVVASTIAVVGGASLQTAATNSANGTTQISLLQ